MNLKKIKRAIISVSNKSNLNLILPILKKYKIEIISSGGTFKKIQSLGKSFNLTYAGMHTLDILRLEKKFELIEDF